MRTLLFSIYGGNALNPTTLAKSAFARGAARDMDASLLSSRNANIFDPPKKPERPFEADYPAGARADETGRLTHDIEGRALGAKYVVGRKVVGGEDVPLPPSDYDAVTEALIGRVPEALTARELGGGKVGAYRIEPTADGLRRHIGVLNTLEPEQAVRVTAHEMGHMIDDLAGDFVRYERGVPIHEIPEAGLLNKELKPAYNSLNNPNRRYLGNGVYGDDAAPWAKPVTPETFRYRGDDVGREYLAEAIRAYMADPNYLKTVAPETAARIRNYVNANPRLASVIQFNADLGRPSLLGTTPSDDPLRYASGGPVTDLPDYGFGPMTQTPRAGRPNAWA